VLGWAPNVDLDQGLRRTVPYFESLLAEGLIKKSSRAADLAPGAP
jgi:hypothetical protein